MLIVSKLTMLELTVCAIVHERDTDFGELSVMPQMSVETAKSTAHSSPSSERINPATLSHLSAERRTELLALLDVLLSIF